MSATTEPEVEEQFDLAQHGLLARREYALVRTQYEELATKVSSILREATRRRGLAPHSITHRPKDLDSFEQKAAKPNPKDPARPKYESPLIDIHDMAGVRVTTYFLSQVELVDRIVGEEFEVIERADKSETLIKENRFGYQSIHLIVKLKEPRINLPEYRELAAYACEVQVRTILQHAWAEIEHDIRYKAKVDIPPDIRRRFLNLAGLLEIADREFETIQKADEHLRLEAEAQIAANNPTGVPITGPNLKLFLDKQLNPDARVSSWLYTFVAKLAVDMGLSTLDELLSVVATFDESFATKHQWRSRPSPPSVLECMLFQHDPERFLAVHPWRQNDWFHKQIAELTDALRQHRATDCLAVRVLDH